MRRFLIALFVVVYSSTMPTGAQPFAPWRFGLFGGVGLNVSGAGYALWGANQLTNPMRDAGHFTADVGVDGTGVRPYAGLIAEYASPSWWGLQARIAYDNRSLTAYDDQSYQVGGRFLRDVFDFSSTYLTIDPRLRIAPNAQSPLSFSIGLGASVGLSRMVAYTADGAETAVTFPLPEANAVTWSMNAGLGYDVTLSNKTASTIWLLTPFLDVSWMVSQRGADPSVTSATANALQTLSARAGIAITRGKVADALMPDPDQDDFYIKVTSPPFNSGAQVRTIEHMPLIPSVFFAPTDKKLPPRYRLRKLKSYDSTTSYYDLVSVAAALLNAFPRMTLTLVGSDPVNDNGLELARIVRSAIMDLAFVDTARIVIKGQRNPDVVTGTAALVGAEQAAALEENRRVDILCSDAEKWPMIVNVAQRSAMMESGMLVSIVTDEVLQPWYVNITSDDLPSGRTFGPFEGTQAVIPEALLPRGPSKQVNVGVTAQSVEGKHHYDYKAMRFSSDVSSTINAERHVLTMAYGEIDPSTRWRTYIKRTIGAHLTDGCRVVVHGHTDDIGLGEVNRKLSHQHAQKIAAVLADVIDDRGVDDVELVYMGHGEDAGDSSMRPESPEGRQYNRAVIVDIIYPAK